MEVVMGIRPVMPATLKGRIPIRDVPVSEYVKNLLDYFVKTHEDVFQRAREVAQEHEGKDKGKPQTLDVGDVVFLKKPPKGARDAAAGVNRAESRCYQELCRVSEKLGNNTYRLELVIPGSSDLLGRRVNKFDADRLIKLCLTPFETDAVQKRLEYTKDGDTWISGLIKDVSITGLVQIERADNPGHPEWINLSRCRFRWLRG